ncbi:ATAD3A [Cordylochernes scorpioides]|uniref:ATAD3A n=1 Tax=Cordylochernes scorpioides TaxID=51811 RepID=A0ABY6LI28_9ARAC|nr:ATAD3A [Cordylochernes scorpioides]
MVQAMLIMKASQEAIKRLEEESLIRQENIRKATADYELEQRAKQDSRLMEAKAKAKAKARRENIDISLMEIREKVNQQRITIQESISSIGNLLGSGFQSFFSSYDKPIRLVGTVTLVAAGIYVSKNSTRLLSRYVESHLFQPALIRESSRVSPGEFLKHPILTSKRILAKPSDALKGVILSPEIEERVRQIAVATANTRKNKGKFRNVLLHGPPGTGKTLFAKKLALHSGLDYAMMSGGDVLPLGRNAVQAIHKVLDWSKTSRKGLILFIDEADAFLSSRANMRMSEDLRAAVNTVLTETGSLSNRMMLVVATNMADELDSAFHNRMDITLEFGLPALEERERLVRHYFDEFVLQPFHEGKSKVKVDQFDFGEMCRDIAQKTEGFSGREIAKMVLSWQVSCCCRSLPFQPHQQVQMAGFTSENGLLTKELIYQKLKESKEQVQLYHLWANQQESNRMKHIKSVLESSPHLNLAVK